MKRTEIMTISMGLIISLVGLYFVVKNSITEGVTLVPGRMVSDVVLMVGGASIIPFFRKDIKNATAASLFTIGAATFIGRAWYIQYSMDGIEVILATIYIVASVVMVYYALSLVFDASTGSFKGIICLSILVIQELGPTFYYWYVGGDIWELVSKNKDDIIYGIMHLMAVIILTRKEMLLETFSKRITKNSKNLYNDMITPPGTYLDIRDLDRIQGITEEGWKEYSEGPVERELSVDLRGAEYGIRLQRWRGEDRTYLTVCRNDSDSYVVALSFPVSTTVVDVDQETRRGRIRFYGNEGMFVDISVRDPDDEKKGYLDTIRMLRRKFAERRGNGQNL